MTGANNLWLQYTVAALLSKQDLEDMVFALESYNWDEERKTRCRELAAGMRQLLLSTVLITPNSPMSSLTQSNEFCANLADEFLWAELSGFLSGELEKAEVWLKEQPDNPKAEAIRGKLNVWVAMCRERARLPAIDKSSATGTPARTVERKGDK